MPFIPLLILFITSLGHAQTESVTPIEGLGQNCAPALASEFDPNWGLNYSIKHWDWRRNPVYVINRTIKSYRWVFGSFYDHMVANGKGKRWLNVGSGEGWGERSFLMQYPELLREVVAVEPNWGANALKYYAHEKNGQGTVIRILEDVFEGVPEAMIGKFDYITDLIGGASYPARHRPYRPGAAQLSNPVLTIQRYMNLLNVDGNAYVTVSTKSKIRIPDATKPEGYIEKDLWIWLSELKFSDFEITGRIGINFEPGAGSGNSGVVHIKRLKNGSPITLPELEVIEVNEHQYPQTWILRPTQPL